MNKAMKYSGGKGGCFRHIVNCMPPHRVYIEPFIGGGNVMFNKRGASVNIAIDADESIIDRYSESGSYADINGDAVPVKFIHGDASSSLKNYNFVGDELVYCDPPYMMETRKGGAIYRHEYTDEQHVELLDILLSLPCYVMVSGYRAPLYESMLAAWECKEFESMTRRGLATECLWMNFVPNGVLHEYTYVGDGFREREKIKRKRQRWRSRLLSMDDREFFAIAETIGEISRDKKVSLIK